MDRIASVDTEVMEELQRHRDRVGRELSCEEVKEIHRHPRMHGWIRYCRTNHEHRKAQGWVLVPGLVGWQWKN
jgi:hypothetical protein